MLKRFIEIDIARALATIAVIAIHVSAAPLMNPHQGRAVALGYLIVNLAARFAVPMFVILSAMGLSLSAREQEGYLSFIKHRLGKIVPAYAIWTLIYSLAYDNVTGQFSLKHSVSLRMVAGNLLSGNACYHLYFVPMIVMLYLLYPMVKKVLATRAGLAAAFVLTIGTICAARYTDYPEWAELLLDYKSPLFWIFYLAVGIWLAKPETVSALKNLRWKKLLPVSLLAYIAGMVVFILHFGRPGPKIDDAIELLGPITVPFTLIILAWIWNRTWENEAVVKALSWISRHSYGIYLSHALVLAAVYRMCYALDGHAFSAMYGIYAFTLVFTGAAMLCLLGSNTKSGIFKLRTKN